MRILILLLFIITIFHFLLPSAYAQTNVLQISESESMNCEVMYAHFAGFVASLSDSDQLIIVSYKGRNEALSQIADERLYNAYIVLKKLVEVGPVPKKGINILPVSSPQVADKGKIEIYVNGKTKMLINFIKNRHLRVGPCVTEIGDECRDSFFKDIVPCRKYSPSVWSGQHI